MKIFVDLEVSSEFFILTLIWVAWNPPILPALCPSLTMSQPRKIRSGGVLFSRRCCGFALNSVFTLHLPRSQWDIVTTFNNAEIGKIMILDHFICYLRSFSVHVLLILVHISSDLPHLCNNVLAEFSSPKLISKIVPELRGTPVAEPPSFRIFRPRERCHRSA